MAAQKRNALGRGLDALLDLDYEIQTEGSSSIQEVELTKIKANPNQPRREFSKEALEELSLSIAEHGIIQPITLRKISDDEYQIIAGERRFRASQMAGKKTIPAYIRTADDENVMEMALIENIQREDLNAIEIALAYSNLMERYHLTQEKLSERVGKKRTTIANYLRLLRLPASVQVALKEHRIDMGHARALLAFEDPKDQVRMLEEVIQNGYSVRQIEDLAKAETDPGKDVKPAKKQKQTSSQDFKTLEVHLSHFFKTRVKLSVNEKGKGKISIPFKNEDELAQLMMLLDSQKD